MLLISYTWNIAAVVFSVLLVPRVQIMCTSAHLLTVRHVSLLGEIPDGVVLPEYGNAVSGKPSSFFFQVSFLVVLTAAN